ncbi:MAG TPA: NAD(P)H-hydrate epimerase [Phycisphaerae bacterium]|nr:NAD(P)H-hydrate epimerase [Phycisphaerae bacterium]
MGDASSSSSPPPAQCPCGQAQPVLTRAQVRRVDELAVTRYRMVGLMLMENAGRNAAEVIDRVYGPRAVAFIACGPGNNGGDGCVIARHLHNRGWDVTLLLAGEPTRLTPDAGVNFGIVEAMNLPRIVAPDGPSQRAALTHVRPDHVIVDALLGTGFTGQVRSPTAELINALNATPRRAMVAVDVPSGLDCDTGRPSNATIRADLTITFVALKPGFLASPAPSFVSRVEVADIGIPQALLAEVAPPELTPAAGGGGHAARNPSPAQGEGQG